MTYTQNNEEQEATASGRNTPLVHGILAHTHHALYGHMLHEAHKLKPKIEREKDSRIKDHLQNRHDKLAHGAEKHRLAGESHYKQARKASGSEEHFKSTMDRAEHHHKASFERSYGGVNIPKSQSYIVTMGREGFRA